MVGAPAYAPDGSRIAFANAARAVDDPAPRAASAVAVAPRARRSRRAGRRTGPRSPIPPAGELRTVAPRRPAPRTVPVAARVTAVDWQPCVAGVTVSCRVASRRRSCSALTATATTEADVPVDLPGAAVQRPVGARRSRSLVVKAPEHGTLAGWRYTPAAGFAGQDTLTYRVSNGVAESELIRVSIFVVRAVRAPAPRPVARRAAAGGAGAVPDARGRRRGWTAAGARWCGSPATRPAR